MREPSIAHCHKNPENWEVIEKFLRTATQAKPIIYSYVICFTKTIHYFIKKTLMDTWAMYRILRLAPTPKIIH